MAFHYHPFFRRKISALFQDFVRHRNFAEVVQVAATAKSGEVFLVKLEVPSQIGGVFGEPLTMPFGVGITAFDAEAESAEHALRSFQLVSKFFELDKRLDAREEFFGKNGLAQEVVGSGFDAAHPIFALAEPGD